jgi:hypothetical protein
MPACASSCCSWSSVGGRADVDRLILAPSSRKTAKDYCSDRGVMMECRRSVTTENDDGKSGRNAFERPSRASLCFRLHSIFKSFEALFKTRVLRVEIFQLTKVAVVGATKFAQLTLFLGNLCLECLDRG